MKKNKSILIPVIIFIYNILAGQEITFKGYGATGYRFYDREILNEYNQEAYYEGKFQADIKINSEIEAQLDFRGNSSDNKVVLREFSVKFEYLDELKFKFGNIKKPFGLDQIENRENLPYIERSVATNNAEEMGYGGRNFSLMAYHNYSKKNPDFPYSYYFSLFRNNSRQTGIAGRFSYHSGEMSYGINYLLINSADKKSIFGNGLGADIAYESDDYFTNLELFFLQDVEERALRSWHGIDESVNAAGIKSTAGIRFDTGAEVIKKIEPFLMGSFFLPDLDVTGRHTLQTLFGINFYFHKKVRLRFNADLRFTKNQYVNEYTTKESRGIIEIQVRF